MSDLAKLIWAIVSQFPDGVSAKKLVKLLYFVDLQAAETLGHTISGATYTYHLFGPFPSGFFHAREELLSHYIRLSFMPAVDLDWHVHRPGMTCALDAHYTEEEREVIEEVLRSLGRYTGWSLERLSKATEPMAGASRGDILHLTRGARQRLIWKRAGIPVETIEVHSRAATVTKEQEARWAQEQVEVVRDLEPFRKRANTASFSEELPEE